MASRLPSVLAISLPLALAAVIGIISFPTEVLAQQFMPPDRGLPGRREGGGTRGGCLHGQVPLVALMPDTNFGQTTQEQPTLYWYTPPMSANTAELVVLDNNDDEVYRSAIALPESGGIVNITLPAVGDRSLLDLNKDYHWYFSLICDPMDRSGDIFVEGWIQRVEPSDDLSRRLMVASTEQERAIAYAESGIWYDALRSVATSRQSRPGDPAASGGWSTLLESIGLDSLVAQPLTP
ncbi:MAG TPA: DUF928 domain-containing protein [Chroococcidiopsis sp.]